MYLSGRNQLLTDMTLAEGFQVLKEAGADAVELCHENPAMGPDQMGQSLAGEIAAALEGAGLRASASGWHCDFVVEDTAYSRLPDLIPLARTLDTDVFIVAGAKDGADRSLWAPMVERTRSLCAVAEDCGVRLAVEYEPGFLVGDSASLLRLFEEVGSPALAANLDLGHAFLCEDEPLDAVRQLGPWIVHCHIENMAAGVHRHLLPWQGDMDLPAYLEALAGSDYQGALALDLYDVDYAAVAPQCFEHLRSLLERVLRPPES